MNKRVNFVETVEKTAATLQQDHPPPLAPKISAKNRWRNAYEKLKMKQLFCGNDPEHEETQELNTPSKAQATSRGHAKHSSKTHQTQNLIVQKFANILKKQFNSLSDKQYKLINDVCYADVDEDFKRRQKLKKKLELNFLSNLDKKTRKRVVLLHNFKSRVTHFIVETTVHRGTKTFDSHKWKKAKIFP